MFLCYFLFPIKQSMGNILFYSWLFSDQQPGRGQIALFICYSIVLPKFLVLLCFRVCRKCYLDCKVLFFKLQHVQETYFLNFLEHAFFRPVLLGQLKLRIGNYLDTSVGKSSCLNYMKVDYLAVIWIAVFVLLFT